MKYTYAEKKKAGYCVFGDCKTKRDSEELMCEKHASYSRQKSKGYMRERYRARRAEGKCAYCAIKSSTTYCEECGSKRRERQRLRRESLGSK